jgi:1,4-dihydroxy-2-naphthoate octaprenyltransferase
MQSFFPAVLASSMASQNAGFSIYLSILALLGVMIGHLGMNLFDDYFDYRMKGAEFREVLAGQGIRSRIGKCRYIISGVASIKQLLVACIILGVISMGIGAIITFYRGIVIFCFAVVTALLGLSYSGAPLRLSYRGIGEVQIGLMFGPLLMSGVYYATCGTISLPVVLVSISVGLLVSNIVYTHSIMDYEPDKKVGKMTFAVLLGNRKWMLLCLLLLLVFSYLTIVVGVIFDLLTAPYLLTLLTLPMAFSLFHLMIEFVRNPNRRFEPQFWMGPMGDWQKMKAMDLDWFMIRWLLARNLLSFFCLVIILVHFIF